MHDEDRIPIWLFIGAILTVYGALIFGAGLYALLFPPQVESRVALFDVHADIWWGTLMVIVGVAYMVRYRPGGPGLPSPSKIDHGVTSPDGPPVPEG